MIREVRSTTFDASGHSNETSMARLMISSPDVLSNKLTFHWGEDSDKFPLTFLTEGQGEQGMFQSNTVEYVLPIMGRISFADTMTYTSYSGANTPGLGGAAFEIYMKTNKFTIQYGIVGPGGVRARLMTKGESVEGRGYKYLAQIKDPDPTAYIPLTALAAGKVWSMTAPTTSESLSRGNKSNVQGPGKLTNQISFNRYTKIIAGNMANKVVEFEVPLKSGGTTRLWLNEEMRQFEVGVRQLNEEHLWESEYNRRSDGTLVLRDYDSGEPVPEGAGVIQQVKEANYDTYGYQLTLQKIKNTVSDVMDGSADNGKMEVVLYCGDGFADDFDVAMKEDTISNGWQLAVGEKMVSGGKFLSYGKYFRQYVDIKGNVITVRNLELFNNGSYAEMQKQNGEIHPRTGKSLISHTGMFIDQSVYDGERNLVMVHQKNQAELTGVYKGLAPIPPSWGAAVGTMIATDEDKSSYEKKYSKGIGIRRIKHCFMIQAVLD
ncbi:hypothetical protein LCGC14_1061650 [marine sediment metagenome]|uniref:Uncharacterized protein n=1 Tax=marine sediment metagenome TaxID=412755 RepID=A0A0F9Q3W5_9ZZZZ